MAQNREKKTLVEDVMEVDEEVDEELEEQFYRNMDELFGPANQVNLQPDSF